MNNIFKLLIILNISGFIISCTNKQSDNSVNAQSKNIESVNSQNTENQLQNSEDKTSIKYSTYCNTKYDYCIDYPSELLIGQGESESRDGQKFVSENGENTLLVYRDFSDIIDPDSGFNLKELYRSETEKKDDKKNIVYKTLGNNFMVISGTEGNKIFYRKSILKNNELVTAIFTYNEDKKVTFDPIIKKIFSNFK